VLGAVASGVATWFATQATASYDRDSAPWESPALYVMMGLTVVFLWLGLAGVSLGLALARGQPVSRGRAMGLAFAGLLFVPPGTVMGLYAL
jgi:hypothetical protein